MQFKTGTIFPVLYTKIILLKQLFYVTKKIKTNLYSCRLNVDSLFSCSSSKKSTGTANRNDVKGTWLLENITYDGLPQSQKLKLTLLDEGNENCLKGSTWVFPNNGNGSYYYRSKTNLGCTPGERNIVWSYRVENGQTILQYKRLTGGVKAKDITDGYKFNIVSATDTNLLLSSKVSI